MKHLIKKSSISLHLSNLMIEAAVKKGLEIGLNISVYIVDESGILKQFTRMDGAALISIDTARKKALTAVGFGMSTGNAWHDFIKDDPILLNGAQNITDFTLLGGGAPIVIDSELIGAIGISGGHYEQDELCVKAALDLLEA